MGTTLTLASSAASQTVYFPAFGRPQGLPRARLAFGYSGAWLVVEATGDASDAVARCLLHLLRGQLPKAIVVDLRPATAIDRGFLATVMRIHRINRSLGGTTRLVGPPDSTSPSWRAARQFALPSMYATTKDATA